ncbi:MAG: lycopene cyclase family protein, partial [Leadbetterella sp.]
MSENQEIYDFAICGAGLAGLYTAYKLANSKLPFSRILIIDREQKNKNDRSWAFWAKESISDIKPLKVWNTIKIVDRLNKENVLPLGSYSYNFIKGIDFYSHIYSALKNNPKIEFEISDIKSIDSTDANIEIRTENKTYKAKLAFDSISPLDYKPNSIQYLQHFYGEVIESQVDCFDDSAPEMMNFGISQYAGECRFIYVIPFSKRKALVEYTIFSDKLLDKSDYKTFLDSYIKNRWKSICFTSTETEFGLIPMTTALPKESKDKRIIKIG